MSVRRLAPKELQPASFALTDENLAWAKQQGYGPEQMDALVGG